MGGYLDGPDGTRVRITKQEFPYDIGILHNIRQGMGGSSLTWLWPFTTTPSNESGLDFETNGFEGTACLERLHHAYAPLTGPSSSWPPPDPDRMPRSRVRLPFEQAFVYNEDLSMGQSHVDTFRRRQQQDLKRYDQGAQSTNSDASGNDGVGWRDSEGDRLEDFGVDATAEFYDDDNISLAELLRRRHESTAVIEPRPLP